MEREDLRSKIIPTIIENTDEWGSRGDKELDTTEKVYLDYGNEPYYFRKSYKDKCISATDYAQMNYAQIWDCTTGRGKKTVNAWLRSAFDEETVNYIGYNGTTGNSFTDRISIAICPSLQYSIPNTIEEIEQLNIKEVKDIKR